MKQKPRQQHEKQRAGPLRGFGPQLTANAGAHEEVNPLNQVLVCASVPRCPHRLSCVLVPIGVTLSVTGLANFATVSIWGMSLLCILEGITSKWQICSHQNALLNAVSTAPRRPLSLQSCFIKVAGHV